MCCADSCCTAKCLKLVPEAFNLKRKGYECGVVLKYRAFFSFLLCSCNVDAGTDALACTLRDAVTGVFSCVSSGTLGDAIGGLMGCGMGCILFSCVARVSNALRTGSPACRLGAVVEGGCVRMVVMSEAACFK